MPEKPKESFEEIARTWDADQGRVNTALTVAKSIREQVALHEHMRVLEFGCGTGLVAMALRDRVGEIVAVDSSPEMLNQLMEKIAKQQVNDIHPILLDWEEQALPAGPFDLIYTSMTLHHIESHLHLLGIFYDRLASGGSLCIADLFTEQGDFHSDPELIPHFGFDPKLLQEELNKMGFRNLNYRHIHTIRKERENGQVKEFPMFLLCGQKE